MKVYKTLTQYKEIIGLLILIIIFFYKIIISNNQMIFSPSSDLIAFSYYKWLYAGNIIQYGELPLWNPYIFGGISFIGNPQNGMFYPINTLFIFFPTNTTFGYIFILDIFFIGLFTYIFARTIYLSKYSSFIAAIIFMFSGTVTTRIYAGHLSLIDSFIWFPLILLFYELAIREKKLIYGILAGFPLTLMFFTGHTQFVAYGLLTSVFYFIIRSLYEIKIDKKYIIKFINIFSISLFTFISLILIQLLPSLEWSKFINRAGGLSFEVATSYSLAPKYLITFLIPEFFGTPVNDTYFFNYFDYGNLWELCGYIGVLPILLALIGIIFIKNKYKIIFLSMALFALLFSFGKYTPIFSIFYYFIPGFDLFRVPARMLFVYAFSFSILAGFGANFLVEYLPEKQGAKFNKFMKILYSITILAVILLFLAYLDRSILGTVIPKMAFHSIYVNKIYMTILQNTTKFVILFASSVYLIHLISRGDLKLNEIKAFIILLILFDLFIFGWNFIDTKDPEDIYKSPEFVSIIKNDNVKYRVLDFSGQLGQQIASRSNIELLNGYDSAFLGTYQEFIGLSGNKSVSANYHNYIQIPEPYNPNILRLLNTKYIITNKEFGFSWLDSKYNQNKVSVYEVKDTLPRAFIIRNARIIEDKTEIFSNLQNKEFSIKEEIILEKDPGVPLHNEGRFEEVEVSLYSPNKIELKTNLSTPGFMVLSEIWYPGWKAYDNGKETEIFKTDYALRSVYIKSGEHKVTFAYEPDSYAIGKLISFSALVIFIIIICIYWWRFK